MKSNHDLTNHIKDAAELVHRAYFAQCLGLEALANPAGIRPPEDILFVSLEWLRKTNVPPARARLLMTYAEIDLRHYIAREIACRAYTLKREKRWKKGCPLPGFSSQLICKTREELNNFLKGREIYHSILESIQRWRQWDNIELGGWVYENVEKTIEELDFLWSKIEIVALRLKNQGQLAAVAMRDLCADIIGAGLKGDRELEIVSGFHYEHHFHGLEFVTSINDGICFVKFAELSEPSTPLRSRNPAEIGDWLSRKMHFLSDGSDAGASAGRLLILLHTGNYVGVGNKLCRVSLPIEPTRGVIADISDPGNIHPMTEDYAWCACTALKFFLAGFIWPTMVACGHDMKLAESLLEKVWITKIYNTFFVIAGEKGANTYDALAFSAAIYARLVAVSGWFNPVIMRQKLREIFWETATILKQFKEITADLEEAIRCGLFRGPEDILALAGGVVDAGLHENPRFATLILYQRDSALLAVEAQQGVHS